MNNSDQLHHRDWETQLDFRFSLENEERKRLGFGGAKKVLANQEVGRQPADS